MAQVLHTGNMVLLHSNIVGNTPHCWWKSTFSLDTCKPLAQGAFRNMLMMHCIIVCSAGSTHSWLSNDRSQAKIIWEGNGGMLQFMMSRAWRESMCQHVPRSNFVHCENYRPTSLQPCQSLVLLWKDRTLAIWDSSSIARIFRPTRLQPCHSLLLMCKDTTLANWDSSFTARINKTSRLQPFHGLLLI